MTTSNYNCLPWYKDINEQNHRKNYAYGEIYPLYSPYDRLLPFQLTRRHLTTIANWSAMLVSMADGTQTDITQYVTGSTGFMVIDGSAQDTIAYSPLTGWSWSMPEGRYYVVLSDGTNTWYSEVFTVVNYLKNYLRISWRSIYDQPIGDGAILYDSLPMPYRNVLYFAAQLGKPEYTFDEEGERRDGYFFAEKQVSTKTYKAFITAPEYLCDVMRLIRMADYVKVTDGYGNEYDCDTFLITPTWQEQGDLAQVTIEFTTGTVIAKKVGLGYHNTGDFNNDFNNDFNT